jgi:hypothetical protein
MPSACPRHEIEKDDPMRRTRSLLFLVPLLLATMRPGQSQGAATPTPILIELFTSEGCSSCPPADAFLKQLDQAQPIPGAQAIVISEHVDYWNRDGWTDPYSSSALTARQDGYVRAFAEYSAYTPQLIVNGKTELRLASPGQVKETLLKAAKAEQLPVSIPAHAARAYRRGRLGQPAQRRCLGGHRSQSRRVSGHARRKRRPAPGTRGRRA